MKEAVEVDSFEIICLWIWNGFRKFAFTFVESSGITYLLSK
jgi:hypothetical protein